jgi:FAD/FMN-containing dehydrogenase
LLAAEIVTAEGEIVRTSADENPELLWALRGAGTNFGVVTEFTLQLHPIDEVLGGFLCYSIDRAREVYDFFIEYAPNMPNELCLMYMGLTTPPEDQFPEHVRGQKAIMLPFIWSGDRAAGDSILAELTAACPPDASSVSWLPYLRMQKWRDDGYGIWGWRNYWKSEFIDRVDEDFFEIFLRYTKAMTSDRDQCHLITLGGQVGNEPAGGSAYANRDAPYVLHIIATWQDPAGDEQHFDWARGFADEIQPFGRRATYLNFITNEGEDRVRAAYGGDEAYERLVALKDTYDPENVFHRNQNILPSAMRTG